MPYTLIDRKEIMKEEYYNWREPFGGTPFTKRWSGITSRPLARPKAKLDKNEGKEGKGKSGRGNRSDRKSA
jgi:hypothetical protein